MILPPDPVIGAAKNIPSNRNVDPFVSCNGMGYRLFKTIAVNHFGQHNILITPNHGVHRPSRGCATL